jgi:hypothetical protein
VRSASCFDVRVQRLHARSLPQIAKSQRNISTKTKLRNQTMTSSMMKKKMMNQTLSPHRCAMHALRCAAADRGKQYKRRALCALIYELYCAIYSTCTDAHCAIFSSVNMINCASRTKVIVLSYESREKVEQRAILH